MRLTRKLCAGIRDVTVRNWNIQWQRHGKFNDQPVKVPPALVQKGVEIVDAKELLKRKAVPWSPPVADDPRWAEAVPPEERADWKTEPAYSFSHEVQLYEGMKQACLIAKAQHFEGLPPAVQELVGAVPTPDRDLLLQRLIMLSQCWNTDETRLPKRKAPPHKILWKFKRAYGITATKSSEILLRSLLRLCQSHVGDLPSLAARRQTYQPLLHSHVMYRDKAIVQRESLDCVVSSDSWLPPFAGEDALDESVAHRIPDMWPVLPTVDFTDIHNYELDSLPGFSRERQFGCPHTILQIGRSSEWSVGQCQASQLLTCLLYTAALARHKFGDNVRILPEPISIQHVSMQPTGFLLTFFQLNTLDLDNSEAGVKNLVWTADKCQLFEKILGQPWMPQPLKRDRLVHFDGAAFEPFLAAYLNGCPELASSAS